MGGERTDVQRTVKFENIKMIIDNDGQTVHWMTFEGRNELKIESRSKLLQQHTKWCKGIVFKYANVYYV